MIEEKYCEIYESIEANKTQSCTHVISSPPTDRYPWTNIHIRRWQTDGSDKVCVYNLVGGSDHTDVICHCPKIELRMIGDSRYVIECARVMC